MSPDRFNIIHHAAEEPFVTFHKDGKIEINPKYSVGEAADAFWAHVIAAARRSAGTVVLEAKKPPGEIGDLLVITYTNWRGETSERMLMPVRLWYGATEWHPEPQWLLAAYDVDKGAIRDFALKDFGGRTGGAL
jgi:hypothetical protein